MRSCVFSISCYLLNISKTGGVSKDAVHWEMVVKVEDEVGVESGSAQCSELEQFLKLGAQAFFQLDYCELSSRGEKESRTSSPWRLRLWGVECGPGAATHRQSLQSRETCRLLLLRPPLILQNWPYHDLEQMHSGLKLHIGRILLFLKKLIKFVKLCLLSSYTVQNSFNLTNFFLAHRIQAFGFLFYRT